MNYINDINDIIIWNRIISLGNRILVETMNYKELQSRAKETTKNKNGKNNKKKRFGKSLSNKACYPPTL